MNEVQKAPWYENKVVVVVLLILFFPVGLFALWKNTGFTTKAKGLLTGVVAIVFIGAMAGGNGDAPVSKGPSPGVSKEVSKAPPAVSEPQQNTTVPEEDDSKEKASMEILKDYRFTYKGRTIGVEDYIKEVVPDFMRKDAYGWLTKKNAYGPGDVVGYAVRSSGTDAKKVFFSLWVVDGENVTPVDGWALSLAPNLVKTEAASIAQYQALFADDGASRDVVSSSEKQDMQTSKASVEEGVVGKWMEMGYTKSTPDYEFNPGRTVKDSKGKTAAYEIAQDQITVQWSDRIVDVFSLNDGILKFVKRHHKNAPGGDWTEPIGTNYKKLVEKQESDNPSDPGQIALQTLKDFPFRGGDLKIESYVRAETSRMAPKFHYGWLTKKNPYGPGHVVGYATWASRTNPSKLFYGLWIVDGKKIIPVDNFAFRLSNDSPGLASARDIKPDIYYKELFK